MATAAIAIPVATAAGANASPHFPQAEASSPDVHLRLGGLRAEVHIDHCGVSERLSGKLLGIEQSLSVCCC